VDVSKFHCDQHAQHLQQAMNRPAACNRQD